MTDKIPQYVTSAAKLAALLGVHRHTIAVWLKQPGAPQHEPKGYPVKPWLTFAAEIAKRAKTAGVSSKTQLEMDKLTEVIRGLKLKNGEEAGELIRIDEVKAKINVLASELKADIRAVGDKLPAALQGLGIAESRAVILQMFNEMLSKVSRNEKAIA